MNELTKILSKTSHWINIPLLQKNSATGCKTEIFERRKIIVEWNCHSMYACMYEFPDDIRQEILEPKLFSFFVDVPLNKLLLL